MITTTDLRNATCEVKGIKIDCSKRVDVNFILDPDPFVFVAPKYFTAIK